MKRGVVDEYKKFSLLSAIVMFELYPLERLRRLPKAAFWHILLTLSLLK
jgi:hypothetical protein